MSVWSRIAEAKITQAIAEGLLDDLPGHGKPLAPDDLSRVPPDVRLGYKILRNAGVAPPEIELRKEIYRLGREIAVCTDERERAELRRRRLHADLEYSIRCERATRLRRGRSR